ncbi:MAG: hypothetical protein JSR65_13290 [Proteobacteria bacterium]|nr:hypothetical protein [Pseudomonadota bacterium]
MSDIRTPQQVHDAEFDALVREHEARLAPLYRKLPQAEPGAALDARIREQARHALHGASSPPQRAAVAPVRARRWLPGFSAVATMLLVAGLAWRLLPQRAQPETAALPSAAEPTATPTPALESAATGTPTLAAKSAPASADRRELAASAPTPASGHDAAMPAPKAAAPRPTTRVMDRAPQLARTASAGEESARAESDAFPATPPRARAVSPAQTEAIPAPTSALAESASALVAPQVAPASPALNSESALARRPPTPAVAQRAAHIHRDADQPQRYRWSLDASSPSPASDASGIYPPDAPPVDIWFSIVRAMHADGQDAAAKRALLDLRRQHPDVSIPADLRDLQ